MNRPSRSLDHVIKLAAGLAGILAASTAVAGEVAVDTTIVAVAVNGGSDVANKGTTCLRIADPVSASCSGGFVAIPNNNNKLLTTTALMSNSTASKVWLYYMDDTGSQHCPGLVFTPCSVISTMPK